MIDSKSAELTTSAAGISRSQDVMHSRSCGLDEARADGDNQYEDREALVICEITR